MRIDRIALNGFRNYDFETAQLSPGTNVIYGENAQGKTNLLEAVYMLAAGKSFRTRFDRELIGFGCDRAEILAEIVSHDREQTVRIVLRQGVRKQITVNSVKKTASELAGTLTAVLFCPDDLNLIKEGAAARRRLMDNAISQIRPRYAEYLSQFNKFYESKTRILKDWHEKPSLLDTLDEFSGAGEKLGIEYSTVSTVKDPTASAKEIFYDLCDHMEAHKRAELDSGQCLSGAHKDDLIISINGKNARSFASQGQTRTAALSIKLAEREIYLDETGEYPILLLDDVLSELDTKRQEFVLNRIGGGQTLITCCEDEGISRRTGGKVLHVSGGRIG